MSTTLSALDFAVRIRPYSYVLVCSPFSTRLVLEQMHGQDEVG